MGLVLQACGVTSAMSMNCAAAVMMADGALHPACGCRISLILHAVPIPMTSALTSAFRRLHILHRSPMIRHLSDQQRFWPVSHYWNQTAGDICRTTSLSITE